MKTIKLILASFLLALAAVPAVSGQDSPSLPYDQKSGGSVFFSTVWVCL
ncbi:MAG: hypothetical protein WCT12_18870 [Verrucomicrobiota bacterium]